MVSGGHGRQRTTDAVLAAVLRDRPAVYAHLAAAHDAAWRAVDPVLLELCRLRIAVLLGCDAERSVRTPVAKRAGLDEAAVSALSQWPSSPRFGARERACLAFCEQFVIDVAGMADDLALDVAHHLGATGLRDLAAGLLVLEQRQRLRLAVEALDLPGVT